MLNKSPSMRKVKVVVASAIILLVCIFGTSFGGSSIDTPRAMGLQVQRQQQQQGQGSGTIDGVGSSEVTMGICSSFHNNDFLTIRFDASFLLSQDGKTGQVTGGRGIVKTTYSNVVGYLSITSGTVNIGVQPRLYSLEGISAFQSRSSYCNLPSTVRFSIAKPDGSQLRCGNSDLIMFNSIPLRGSVTGNVKCIVTTLVPSVGTIPMHPESNIKTHTTAPDNVKIISAIDDQGRHISNGAVNVPSKSITFQLSRPTDNVGVASLECNIDGSIKPCPSRSSSVGSIVSYNNLNPGSHSFTFMAKDSEGNVSSDRFTWTTSALDYSKALTHH
ncbi:MAG TPA: hypothetical protein VI278_16545 [Nitrososphaeraceae archaeon]